MLTLVKVGRVLNTDRTGAAGSAAQAAAGGMEAGPEQEPTLALWEPHLLSQTHPRRP